MLVSGKSNRAYREHRNIVRATKALVYAAATEQAKANMQWAGQTTMNDEDADVMFAVFDRLFHEPGGPEAWLAMESE